jgi:hypothetical protein
MRTIPGTAGVEIPTGEVGYEHIQWVVCYENSLNPHAVHARYTAEKNALLVLDKVRKQYPEYTWSLYSEYVVGTKVGK